MRLTRQRKTAALAVTTLAIGIGLLPRETASQVTAVIAEKPKMAATIRYPGYPVAKAILPIVPPRAAAAGIVERKGLRAAIPATRAGAPQTARKTIAVRAPLPGRQALGAAPLAGKHGAALVAKGSKAAKSKQASAKR